MMDIKESIKDIKVPLSLAIGIALGTFIGFIVGIISGGFIIEVFFRSIVSGLILGGTLFGVEKLLKKFVPEFFEENISRNTSSKKLDIIEEGDNVSIEDIYLNSDINSENKEYESSDQTQDIESDLETFTSENYSDSEFDKGMKFSEDNAFRDLQDLSSEELTENAKYYNYEDQNNVTYEEKRYSEPIDKPTSFEPIKFSTAEIGVTKQSTGGTTQDFIIPKKGKPIPLDYKKLAEAIRTKLKED
ncbi:MAG: hypothetical protein ACK4F9_02410 [Brevinematia bacterium]